MNIIHIKICTGTTCFVMGGSDLLVLEDHLTEDLKTRVQIEGSNCLDWCKKSESGRPPFVQIQDEMMEEATIPKILTKIDKLCHAQDQ